MLISCTLFPNVVQSVVKHIQKPCNELDDDEARCRMLHDVNKHFCCLQSNYTAIRQACNHWRNSGDVFDSWSSVKSIVDWAAANQDAIVPAAGPGGWNDPDMVHCRPVFDLMYTWNKDTSRAAFW